MDEDLPVGTKLDDVPIDDRRQTRPPINAD